MPDGQPLDGIRVLEFTHYVAGPYCGRLLADYGASVLKIEPPTGDPGRHLPPKVRLDSGMEQSLLHLYLNHGKELLTLDLTSNGDADRAIELIRKADVVIENFRPGALARRGLGWEALRDLNPRLILTSISNCGQSGPYRDYRAWDIVADALGGLSYIFGYSDREPLTHPNPQAQYRAGTCAAAATVAALFGRETSGLGDWVDISIMECVASALRDTIPQYTYMGAVRRRGAIPDGGFGAITACEDGYVIPTAFGAANWETFTRFLDAPEMQDDRFATGDGRVLHAAVLATLLRQRLAAWDKFGFFHSSQEWGIGAGIVLTPAEVAASDQLAARDFLRPLDLADGTVLPAPRRPFNL
jgi:crotonobetainyl-CoA:carnitine CoA-transferase CaiB-like acyl-CoA transferase